MTERSGRRPGQSGTREAILDSARKLFADNGFDKTSVRSIAAAAGVDSALVHHYFGTKQDLFVAAIQLPIDPRILVRALDSVPLAELGEHLVRTVVTVWDSPAGDGMVAAFRGIVGGGDTSLIRHFMVEIALRDVRERVDRPSGSGRLRVELAASQMIGLGVARMILKLEPLASLGADDAARLVGPTIQRYLTGDLDAVR